MSVHDTVLAVQAAEMAVGSVDTITIIYIERGIVEVSLQGHDDNVFRCSIEIAANLLGASGIVSKSLARSQIDNLSDGSLVYSRQHAGTGFYHMPTPADEQ